MPVPNYYLSRPVILPLLDAIIFDDISLISISPADLQSLVDIIYTPNDGISINCIEVLCPCLPGNVLYYVPVYTKTRNIPTVNIYYGDVIITYINNTIHFWIRQDSNMKVDKRIDERCQKAKTLIFLYALLPILSRKRQITHCDMLLRSTHDIVLKM